MTAVKMGRPAEAPRTVARLRRTPGQWQDVGTFNPHTALDRAKKLEDEGAEVEVVLRARVRVGQRAVAR